MNAQEFINSISSPIVFWSSIGIWSGLRTAVLDDTEFPFDLSTVNGSINTNGEFEWDGEGDFLDYNNNSISMVIIYADADEFDRQNEEYNSGSLDYPRYA